jgi:hypothetical protein
MAKKFLTSLNLSQNQLQNAVIHSLSTAPSTGSSVEGQIYYDTSLSVLRYFDGEAWITLAQGGDLASAISAAIDELTTDDIEEGSNNLYFTDERAVDAVAAALGDGIEFVDGSFDVQVGTGLVIGGGTGNEIVLDRDTVDTYYDAAGTAQGIVDALDTDDIEEGFTNLYFSDARARTAIDAGDNTINYNSSTGDIAVNTSVIATVEYVNGEITAAEQAASDANNTLSSTLTTAYQNADNTLSTNLTTAYQAADTALETSLTEDFTAADNVVITTLRSEIAAATQGLDVKESVRAATTGNVGVAGSTPNTIVATITNTIDGVTFTDFAPDEERDPTNSLVFGDPAKTRILVKNQTDASLNGIYYFYSYDGATEAILARTDDALGLTPGTFVFVEGGTVNGDAGFVISTDGDITVGTTGITWTQFSGTGQIVAGDGITKTGSTLSVDAGDGITVDVNGVSISNTYAGQDSIDTVGTIAFGIWEGSTIDVAHGGTGATTLTGYVVGDGANALSATSTIPGSDIDGDISGNAANVTGTVAVENGGTGATTAAGARSNLGATTKYTENNTTLNPTSNTITWTVTHSLNTSDVTVQMRDLQDNALVEADVVLTNANTVTISWYSAVTVSADAYRVVVVG